VLEKGTLVPGQEEKGTGARQKAPVNGLNPGINVEKADTQEGSFFGIKGEGVPRGGGGREGLQEGVREQRGREKKKNLLQKKITEH